MKNKTIGCLLAMASLMLFVGCDLHHADNGKLDGMWHLERVDTLLTGGQADFSNEYRYWSFQGKLLHVEDKTGAYASCLLRFKHVDGKLYFSEPYRYDRENGDEPLTDAELLRPFGINQMEEVFDVEHLSDKTMVVKSSMLRLYLRHF